MSRGALEAKGPPPPQIVKKNVHFGTFGMISVTHSASQILLSPQKVILYTPMSYETMYSGIIMLSAVAQSTNSMLLLLLIRGKGSKIVIFCVLA